MAERIKNAEELIGWLETEDILFRLSAEEADVILGYLEGSGYSLESEAGTLYLCDDGNSTREKTKIDDVVDLVCETNYELIEETTVKIAYAEIGEDTEHEEAYLASLMKDETILDRVFSRTCYQKEMDQKILKAGETVKPPVAGMSRSH